ncbi:TPA: hypothetical protein ACTPQP_000101 [Salmonella enterica]|uniref:hypothetical protein n=1 Tax=Klebsiella TaxID=570 RepID=UPI0011203FAE|nr:MULTISPECIES: hypothetical protein [Klebsiella]EBM4186652.1 hypothetical protein [Salmonella enterica]ECF6266348.1 hypothetical protein [Salmonella enterica subsp. arizonae]HAW0857875.1 hypothetical protein [Escherichia coli]ECF6315912.1 hypothetical protein [Salmonella enterica]ECG1183084.1 hypothetical protein [Salmonella enterica subsp. arizonae]
MLAYKIKKIFFSFESNSAHAEKPTGNVGSMLKAYKRTSLTEDDINEVMTKAVAKYNKEHSRDIFEDDY